MKRRPREVEPAARSLAFDTLLRVEQSGAYASILLNRAEGRLDDSRDAGLLHELVLGTLRRQLSLDEAIAQVSHRPPSEMDLQVRIAMRLGAYELLFLDRIPDFAAVDSSVELIKQKSGPKATGFVNGTLRNLARRGRELLPPPPGEGDVEQLARHHSHPPWWVRRLVDRLGWQAADAMLARNNRPAATVLRTNLMRSSADSLSALLAGEGIESQPGRFAPHSLRLGPGPIQRSRVLGEGLAWVQDEAAQLVPMLFGERVGPRVCDLCAAPGGKTMHLAQALPPGGTVVASDRHLGRLRRLVTLAERLGMQGILPVHADLASMPPFSGPFDQVLVDAPCSGTGTLRRHPEIRWRLSVDRLKLLAGRQSELLATAASLLDRDGQLVYAVCSVEPEEGEQVVQAFLKSHTQFRLSDPRPELPEACGEMISPEGFLRTSPLVDGLDGFFAARMVRTR